VSDAGPAPIHAMRLPFFSRGHTLRQQRRDVVTMIGGDAGFFFQSANGDGLFLDSAAAAGGFARSIANPAQNAREYVGFSIHHVGLGELALRYQADVFGTSVVRRTGPLAIYHPMK